ncbi:MAG: phospholipase A [Elusimicrobiales bacterium]|nr:phospholipase A [Elusimicrobiales bacterium]
MKITTICFISALFFSGYCEAGAFLVEASTAAAPQDVNNPENTLPTSEQQAFPQSAYFGKKTDRPVSAHKVNYFSIDQWPGNNHAQVKFQISMKFRLLEPNLYVLKYNLFPAYIGYTQKSLWNEGRSSRPFEETNYNPEFFLDYPVKVKIAGRLRLRNIIICPIEHESNGLDAARSRSWNRQYIMVKLGVESRKKLEIPNSFLSDKALFYVKLWQPSGYSDQDAYLKSIGSGAKFLDYMGRGEVGLSVRNFLWGGSLKNHQLDIKTPIFRDSGKRSYEFGFRQQLPEMNFAIYLQYWYGYGETLLRFDRFGRRGFAGLSFSY